MFVTVLLPTFNPRMDYLESVLEALRHQTVPVSEWDLVVVDNNSSVPISSKLDLRWHPRAVVLHEQRPGKMRAQILAFKQLRSDLVIIVDDDNVLAPDYLERVVEISQSYPFLGSWSGRIELSFEDPDDQPPKHLRHLLAERLVEKEIWSNDSHHIQSTPWGAGMCIRRVVADAYVREVTNNPRHLELDPLADKLRYGGDTDVAYVGCSIGLGMGVFPQLHVTHLIPKTRCTRAYLMRNLEAHAYSEVLHHWVLTGCVPDSRSDLWARLSGWVRWLLSSELDREVIKTIRRGHKAARFDVGTRVHIEQDRT
jgi:glycosyltransferase involved in cell wall biosynthesis